MSEPLLGHYGLLGLPALNICPHTVSRYVAECQLAKVHKFYAEKQYQVCAMVNCSLPIVEAQYVITGCPAFYSPRRE